MESIELLSGNWNWIGEKVTLLVFMWYVGDTRVTQIRCDVCVSLEK